MKRLIRYFFIILNGIAALLLVVSYFSPRVDPLVAWWPSFIGLAYSYLLLMNIGFVVFWLFFYWRYLFLSLLCILAGWHTHQNFIQFSGLQDHNSKGIKIISYNVLHFYSYLEGKNDTEILDFIAGQEANIICLQESKLQKTGALNPVKLKEYFPGIKHVQLAHQSTWGGPVTFTSYPIVNMGELRFEDSSNMVIYTDVKIDGDTIRVYNCHMQSYGIRPEQYSIIDSIGFQRKQLQEVRQISKKLKDAYIQRSVQIKELKKSIESCPFPVIVCGDFNDTPVSFSYHAMRSVLNDAFVESGKGVSNTYRGKLPSFRIDYIFYSNDFRAYNYERSHVEYSDHFPISTKLIMR